jgi:hypothetical protein
MQRGTLPGLSNIYGKNGLILQNTGHKAPTYRQIAGIALHRPVVQIPVFGLCLTI